MTQMHIAMTGIVTGGSTNDVKACREPLARPRPARHGVAKAPRVLR